MRLRHKSICYLKKKIVRRGPEGNKYADFSDQAVEIMATICSGEGKVIAEQEGLVQQYQKKLLFDDPFQVTNEDGVETYWFCGGEYSMAAGDGCCIYAAPSERPDYQIAAIRPVGQHLRVLLERI
ncbi:MAG: hypothetical protein NC409_12595 [Clostridium sp.]|nr:hypothetical protein [Clostridium sp.]